MDCNARFSSLTGFESPIAAISRWYVALNNADNNAVQRDIVEPIGKMEWHLQRLRAQYSTLAKLVEGDSHDLKWQAYMILHEMSGSTTHIRGYSELALHYENISDNIQRHLKDIRSGTEFLDALRSELSAILFEELNV
jgi:hypothetical protein